MLGDFFRINLPYGIKRTESSEWYAFNREYMPLAFNDESYKGTFQKMELPIYTKYKGITERKLKALAWEDPAGIHRNDKGDIIQVWFYNDGLNPSNDLKYWNDYILKLKILATFLVDKSIS
ncbi:hypothetical protein BWI96_17275 [Siphonobacter sp. SORGH_AS_0500]|uniref:hypothetical protein n=1 Tax=Siphonobacter sp. SORGH_AS_0500 TaxID=1864824 RepID=UPI000CBB30B7|nr:hypothetical protein [Siphonobacter sp. SORGH_AS_0500]PKK35288.1 hypothetical protein BWI96_17275 [Siphonobacter sp. SORGH_AS_0500]